MRKQKAAPRLLAPKAKNKKEIEKEREREREREGMKNPYAKCKGKIHPSPGGGGEALAVLNLLPAAILVLTAALSGEDKEVVAYLMIRSINGAEERRRLAGAHRPAFDCGCFDCYTSFWSRWDCSSDREAIHLVVEAFEEHLASAERANKGKDSKRKRKKDKREGEKSSPPPPPPLPPVAAMPEELSEGCVEDEAVSASEECFAEAREEVEEEEEEEAEESPSAGGERRRGWADVVGIFNSRLWSLWGPGA